ncbi:MAG: hypothetical protein KKD76_01790 [Verrucomicrobia bacterium]|nr:hypothetical protein [Verrucomicrobiota bacterium]
MNTRASMARRDRMAACVLTLAVAAFLFIWSPSLHPGFSPARLTPPAITYCPALLTTGDHQEHYDEWNAAHSPALIALSATMMLSPDKRGQTDAVTPPLDTAARLLRFPDTPPTERNDQIPMLTPPRPMTPLTPQRFALPTPVQRPSLAPPAYRMDLTGNWQGRSVDLAPMFAIREPSGPWSFTAVLRYDETGRVQHALLESAALDLPLRDEVIRRLYQCRVTPSSAPGEGRLTVYGPGRASRP